MNRLVKGSALLAVLAFAVAVPWIFAPYTVTRIGSALYLSVAVLSLMLLIGLNGQISIGQAAFMGIGAYALTILVSDAGWPYWAATIAAVLLAAVAGLLVGIPALRLRGLYVALMTLGAALVFPTLLQRFSSLTGGTGGKSVTSFLLPPQWTGLSAQEWT